LQQLQESPTPAELMVMLRMPDHEETLSELTKRPDHFCGPWCAAGC
jgi:hypothetical protein